MATKTYVEVLKGASSFLENHGKEPYLAEYMLLERLGWTRTELLISLRKSMPQKEQEQLEEDLKLVIANHPPQYIIGSCEFYGARFKVTENTLIPRPETEELVAMCLNENNQQANLKVMDVGTGTGAIALTLKREAKNWEVSASDISREALTVAKENAKLQDQEVLFYEGDLLEPVRGQTFDIIISNPPYISQDEFDVMDVSVREYEPSLALFAENEGLAIYQKLASQVGEVMHQNSRLYLEIGFQQGSAVVAIFKEVFPEKTIRVHKDLFGQDRMVSVH
ncbi:peptide chain release factor N(5)-glutamine methyltransferase [Vagococcus intermedius]|uniref:Release factor glutamine methyltransferase n=1 Tax=Vagococcus intermedius TaxID=2991418 RepID=A0AAF0I7E9_9ENTE|nr:peptide chain release factor N(5)-glutamine methyltransferase [Vagococcus intermedius]WEG72961.1 peptide chain release factor N(5)-glutamine methyltransferase [Vagococcus intermedius]WEG75047.1 peptide chain release factor N(5)-glutamine methyltransferase [Vagococcus intermedius]